MGGVLDAQRRQVPWCVCLREREIERGREIGAGASGLELMLALQGLAHTAFGIIGRVCNGSRSSCGMAFFLLY